MNILKKLGPLANFEFNKLFSGQLFSHFADAMIQFLVVAILIQQNTNAGKYIALVFFFFLLPQFLLSTLTGQIADKISRQLALGISCIIRFLIVGVFICLIYSGVSINNLGIYTGIFILGTCASLFYTTKMAAVTNIVESNQLKFANALTSSIGAICFLLGALGANFILGFGLNNALTIIAIMYAIAGILTGTLKFKYPQKKFQSSNPINDLKESFVYLKSHKKVLFLVYMSICVEFIVAIFSNSLNSLITDYYRLTFSDLTYLRTLLGIGIILGTFATIHFARLMRIPHLFASGFIVLCLALATAPLCKNIAGAWLWLIPIGLADAVVLIMIDTILQKITPDRVRGKIFGLELTFTTLSSLIGTMLVVNVLYGINQFLIFKGIAIISFVLASIILIVDKSFRYFLLKATLGQIFLTFFRYKVEGAENIPFKGRVILAGNHTGHLDPFIIQMATKRQLWFVTGPAAFQVPVVKHFLKYFNVLPLKFGKGLEAIETANEKLRAGEAVIIFPEGKFTPDGNLCKFNRGVGLMAKATNTKIVPFAIKGGFETWGKTRKLPRLFNTIVIQFGQPLDNFESDEKEIAKELQTRVNFMKNSLERRAFYNIKDKFHTNFLDLMQEKGDIYGQVKALSLKTDEGYEELLKQIPLNVIIFNTDWD